jgi:hypothetical protein
MAPSLLPRWLPLSRNLLSAAMGTSGMSLTCSPVSSWSWFIFICLLGLCIFNSFVVLVPVLCQGDYCGNTGTYAQIWGFFAGQRSWGLPS